MKPVHFLALLLLFSACNQKESRLDSAAPQAQKMVKWPVNYDSCKKAILLLKQKQEPAWAQLPKQAKELAFTKAVTETIIPGWIGTGWSFNGTSEKPQQGTIACGYFVTTILRDAGLQLARIKLAQCASEQMILSLIQPKYVSRFSNKPMGSFLMSVTQQGPGLYIVGLDNHTGFIHHDGQEIYFIHSTFLGTRNVQKEIASLSWVLSQSKYKVLGKISADEKILERWIH